MPPALGRPLRAAAIVALACAAAACSGDKVRKPGAPPGALTIFYTCDTRGHIEPCGCSSGMAGGVSRRMAFLKSSAPEAFLLVDAGDVTAGQRDWERFEASYILKAYKEMGYHAVNAGHREAQLTPVQLRELDAEPNLYLSANLVDTEGAAIFPPYRIVDFPKGYQVGIIGIMENTLETHELGKGLAILPPQDALAKHLPGLARKTDAIVLLAFTGEEEMKALAEQFFELDVIIGGNVIQPLRGVQTVNQSILASITDKGKAVGRLDLTADENGYMAKANEIHMLLEEFPQDPAAAAIVDAFKGALAGMDFQPHRDDEEGLTTITAARSKSANKYVDAQTCATCHPKAFALWQNSKHAHAFQTLADKNDQYNPRCLACHAIGYGTTDGYINARLTPNLKDVSCGNCHGRGDYHIRFHAGEDVPERAAKLKSVQCETCHDKENSINFNLETYWEKIVHDLE